jgi:uncharacterized protein (TIGR02145 family)
MKTNLRIYLVFLLCTIGLLLNCCCKKGEIPLVNTSELSSLTDTTVQCGGTVISDGGSEVTERGVQWSFDSSFFYKEFTMFTMDGSGLGSFSSYVSGLATYQIYYIRAYATNEHGIGFGEKLSFRPPEAISEIKFNPAINYGTLTDQDGNTYKTVVIGTQTWMAENLRTTRYNDGASIPFVENGSVWLTLRTPAYCWYDNDESYFKEALGALYNWYTVNTGKLCPSGWHIPDDIEWNTMITFLGGNEVAGGKMKETGSIHWQWPNVGATNESGFTALPGGWRWGYEGSPDGSFYYQCRYKTIWWTSLDTDISGTSFYLNNFDPYVHMYDWGSRKWNGESVRCVKN